LLTSLERGRYAIVAGKIAFNPDETWKKVGSISRRESEVGLLWTR